MGMQLPKLPFSTALASLTRHLTRLTAVATVAIGLTACLDGETTLVVDPDGKARMEYVMSFDKEAEDAFAFFKALGDVAPEAAPLKLGLCPAASMLSAMVPEFRDYKITGSEERTDTAYVCKIAFDIGPVAQFQTLIAKLDPWGMYEVKEVGPRRYSLAIDYSKMPDLSEIVKEVVKKQQEAAPSHEHQPNPQTMEKIAERSIKAGVALVRLMAKDRKSNLVIASSGQIVESNGTISPDKKLVRFTMTTEEAIGLMLKSESRKDKRFYAVIEY
jgi:hypothetical protein